jgi:hypothetical protein
MTLLVIADNARPVPNASEECTFLTDTAGSILIILIILIKLRSTSIHSLAKNHSMSYHDSENFSLLLCGPTNRVVDPCMHATHILGTSAQQVV